jgi:hypothetical protein
LRSARKGVSEEEKEKVKRTNECSAVDKVVSRIGEVGREVGVEESVA